MKDEMSDGGVDVHVFAEDVCVHSLFAFPLWVPLPSTNLLSKEMTFQLDQPLVPTFN